MWPREIGSVCLFGVFPQFHSHILVKIGQSGNIRQLCHPNALLRGCAKRVVRMFLEPKHRKEGTKTSVPGPQKNGTMAQKTGARVHSPKLPFYKNRPCVFSRRISCTSEIGRESQLHATWPKGI